MPKRKIKNKNQHKLSLRHTYKANKRTHTHTNTYARLAAFKSIAYALYIILYAEKSHNIKCAVPQSIFKVFLQNTLTLFT